MTVRLSDRRGFAQVFTLTILMAFFMLLTFLMFFAGLLIKQRIVSQEISRAIAVCETQNYDLEYTDLIEGQSYDDATDYNSDSYKAAFFSAIEAYFPHHTKTSSDGGTTYAVDNDSGRPAFTIEDLTLDVSAENMAMPDTQTRRLVYRAAGTLAIPVGAFGFTGTLRIPIDKTATYQDTG